MKTLMASALLALVAGLAPAWAQEVQIVDPTARVMGQAAKSGAAFFTVQNSGAEDRLIAARSPAAERVELHTHRSNDQGVMQMLHVPEGFVIPAEGQHALARGGDHVMLMGLTQSFKAGDQIDLTLVFELAGEVTVKVPVEAPHKMGHGH